MARTINAAGGVGDADAEVEEQVGDGETVIVSVIVTTEGQIHAGQLQTH